MVCWGLNHAGQCGQGIANRTIGASNGTLIQNVRNLTKGGLFEAFGVRASDNAATGVPF